MVDILIRLIYFDIHHHIIYIFFLRILLLPISVYFNILFSHFFTNFCMHEFCYILLNTLRACFHILYKRSNYVEQSSKVYDVLLLRIFQPMTIFYWLKIFKYECVLGLRLYVDSLKNMMKPFLCFNVISRLKPISDFDTYYKPIEHL